MILQLGGAVLMLLAYFGLQARWWGEMTDRYLILNILGAGILAAVAIRTGQWGFALLNTVWCLVAIRSLFVPGRIR